MIKLDQLKVDRGLSRQGLLKRSYTQVPDSVTLRIWEILSVLKFFSRDFEIELIFAF